MFTTPNEFSKLNKPKVRYSRPWGLSPSMMKSGSRNACRETQSNMHMCYPKVNFSKLGTNTLWRYYTTFNLVSLIYKTIHTHVFLVCRNSF
ncbi:putative histone deacetylase complex subunit SAP30/SAP30 [Helianthus anomalus]